MTTRADYKNGHQQAPGRIRKNPARIKERKKERNRFDVTLS